MYFMIGDSGYDNILRKNFAGRFERLSKSLWCHLIVPDNLFGRRGIRINIIILINAQFDLDVFRIDVVV